MSDFYGHCEMIVSIVSIQSFWTNATCSSHTYIVQCSFTLVQLVGHQNSGRVHIGLSVGRSVYELENEEQLPWSLYSDSPNNRLSKFLWPMLHAHLRHIVHIYHKSHFPTDCCEKNDPLESFESQFLRVWKGFRGFCLSQ